MFFIGRQTREFFTDGRLVEPNAGSFRVVLWASFQICVTLQFYMLLLTRRVGFVSFWAIIASPNDLQLCQLKIGVHEPEFDRCWVRRHANEKDGSYPL